MTDLEMTRLCAEAMSSPEHGVMIIDGEKFDAVRERNIDRSSYDPLHDDAQAMALVKKFRLVINPTDKHGGDQWEVWPTRNYLIPQIYDEDLNRAIVRCFSKTRGKAK